MEELEQGSDFNEELPNDFDGYQAFLEDLDAEALTTLSNLDTFYNDDSEDDFGFEDRFSDSDFVFDLGISDNTLSPELQKLHSMFTPQLKSKTVNYEGVDNEIKNYISSLPENLRSKVVVTSGMDGTHAKGSKHYTGRAVDLRYDPELHSYIAQTAGRAGLRTINPYHGTAPHTHLERMQFGGINIADMNDPLSRSLMESIQKGINNANSTSTNSGGLLNGVVNTLGTIGKGVGVAQDFIAAKGQQIFDVTNGAMDTAISLLGQGVQNRELQRLQELRNSDLLKAQSPTAPIKNIPAYI